jgi:hypothetical protein
MVKRGIDQGSIKPVVIYDPATEEFLQGAALPVVFFNADGSAVDWGAAGENGELQYNNSGVFGGTTDIVFNNTAIEMQNDATVWVDLNFGGASLRGATAPDFIALNGGNIQVRGFDGVNTTEELFGQVEMNHYWKEGSTIYPHLHWMPSTAAAGNVNWQLDYNIIADDATPAGETNINTVVATPEVAWQGVFTGLPSIDMSGYGIGTQFAFRLFRDPTDSDTYGADAALLTFGLHIEVDTIGSRQITTK